MLDFIMDNLDFILSLICAFIACIYFARRGQIAKIRQIVLALCVDAELTFGGGTGEIKKSSVLEAIYRMLPSWAKLFISGTTLTKLVEEGKSDMDALASGSSKVVMNLLYDTASK